MSSLLKDINVIQILFLYFRTSSAKATEVLNNINNESVNWYLETRRKALASGNRVQVERLSEQWKTDTDPK